MVLCLFGEETVKFVVIGKTESVGFFSHDLIKFGKGCFIIRFNKNLAYAAAENTEYPPANEGKIENEDLPFFAFGHLAGKFKSAFARDLRIFRKDIGYHAVFIGFDDSGDYKKKTPKEDFDFFPEHDFYYVHISSASESPEKAFKAGTESAVFHEVTVFADNDRTGNKSAPTESNHKSDGKSKGNYENSC